MTTADSRIRIKFFGQAHNFVLAAAGATYFTSGAAATLTSTSHQHQNFALVAGAGAYAYSGPSPTLFFAATAGAPNNLFEGWSDTTALQFGWWPPANFQGYATALFQASLAGTVLTVTAISGPCAAPIASAGSNYYGTIRPGDALIGASAGGVEAVMGMTIAAYGTGGTTGVGGTGTYTVLNGTGATVGSGPFGTFTGYYKVYELISGTYTPVTIGGGTLNPGFVTPESCTNSTQDAARFLPWFVHAGLTPGTTHTYRVSYVNTASGSPVEGPMSPPLTMTTLSLGASTPFTLPPNPNTWIQEPVVPVGGTTWFVNQNTGGTSWNTPGTDSPPGNGLKNNGCGLLFALNGSNINGGDIIAIDHTKTYPVPSGSVAFQLRAYNGTLGTTYICTDADPTYQASLGATGTLIPYEVYARPVTLLAIDCSGTISAGATSATLAVPWARKTGWYYVHFTEPTLVTPTGTIQEERLCSFTRGSATFTWLGFNNLLVVANNISAIGSVTGGSGYTLNGNANFTQHISITGGSGTGAACVVIVTGGVVGSPNNFWGGSGYTVGNILSATVGNGAGSGFSFRVNAVQQLNEGLSAQANSVIQVAYTPAVTPADATSMPKINWGVLANQTCFNIPAACKNVRFVGLNLEPVAGSAHSSLIGFQFTNVTATTPATIQAQQVYVDRCLVGNDTNKVGWCMVTHPLSGVTCDNFLLNQSYIWGCTNNFNVNVGDSNILLLGGGPKAIQNSYIQCGGENIIWGGAYIPAPPLRPHEIVIRGTFSHKPLNWLLGGTATPFNSATVNSPWYRFGRTVKNHIEAKSVTNLEVYGNLVMNCWWGVIQSYYTAAFSFGARDQQVGAPAAYLPFWVCPWTRNTDAWFHDNCLYNIGTPIYAFTGDNSPTTFVARAKFSNNISFINPQDIESSWANAVQGMHLQGPMSDFIIDHNTDLVNTANTIAIPFGTQGMLGVTFVTGGTGLGSYPNPSPYIPNANGWHLYQDKFVLTNNIIDTGLSSPSGQLAFNFLTTVPKFGAYPNATINKNVTVNDPTVYQGTNTSLSTYVPGTINSVPYASLGLKNYTGPATGPNAIPLDPSDWNVVSGSLATAGTDGGPVGSVFNSLASDPFPRTFWQVIAPGAGSGTNYAYANPTFQANAAQFDLVNLGSFMGIEQTMGNTTFQTIITNIKTQAKLNGIPNCRVIQYVNSANQSATATSSGSGSQTNGGTFYQWTAALNAANWWIRTSYPAGSIVIDSFGASDGSVMAVTSKNTVTYQPTGASAPLTFFQAFWFHYDGVLRLGNAVSQGYPSNLAMAACPALDGYQMDNVFAQPRETGAWGMDGTSYTTHWPSSADPVSSGFIQQGQALQISALRKINPSLIILCNADYFVRSTTNFSYQNALDNSQVAIIDAVYCQSCIGGPDGIEGQGGTTTADLMANLIAAEAQMAPGGTLIFEQTGPSHGAAFSNTNQAVWTNSVGGDWQAVRYGAGCCFQRNWHYALNFSENYGPTAPYFADETQPQGGVKHWLGSPIDPPQYGPRTSGVWWRRYRNGVVFMNPRNNGTPTLTLASLGLASGLKAITNVGFGDPAFNTGAVVTSITFRAGDGRFLIGPP